MVPEWAGVYLTRRVPPLVELPQAKATSNCHWLFLRHAAPIHPFSRFVKPTPWESSFIAGIPNQDYNTALPDGAWRSPASALAWGARGPGFNSRRPDWRPLISPNMACKRFLVL
jgi:hypothetical protein